MAGTSLDIREVGQSFLFGAFAGALGGVVEGAVTPLAKVAGSRGRSIGMQMFKVFKTELRKAPVSAAEEALSNTIPWLLELIYYSCVTR